MIIGIDGNEANVENRVGIGEYGFELLQQFNKSKIYDLTFIIYLKNKPLKDMPEESENWQYRVIGPKNFWTQFALPFDLLIRSQKPDVFFSPSHYAPRFSPIPTVISVMDLSYLHFPELFKKSDLYQLKNWTAYSVKNAKKILTISNSSKDDIIKHYRVPESKIAVTYLGIRQIPMNKSEDKRQVKNPYILFVGTIQPRKNIERLIQAFSKIQDKKIQLIVVGKKGWLYESILKAPKKFKVEERVVFKDFVTDKELNEFYKNAEFFILPSLYEGFGLPVLEAMQKGCPVITSNISSLPEAGGDACLYVDPMSIDDMVEKMNTLLTNETLRMDLIKKGYEQVKKFSWEKTARETLDILMKVGGRYEG